MPRTRLARTVTVTTKVKSTFQDLGSRGVADLVDGDELRLMICFDERFADKNFLAGPTQADAGSWEA